MTVTERTDKLIALMDVHDPLQYRNHDGMYMSKDHPLSAGHVYYLHINYFSPYVNTPECSTEMRAFLAYAWYVCVTRENTTALTFRFFERPLAAGNLYFLELLIYLGVPINVHKNTRVHFDLVFDTQRLHNYNHPRYDKRN